MSLVELEDDSIEYKVWLVWKLQDGHPWLVAIDTSEERARKHVLAVEYEADALERPRPETFVEESRTNHFYGESVHDLPSFKVSKYIAKMSKLHGVGSDEG